MTEIKNITNQSKIEPNKQLSIKIFFFILIVLIAGWLGRLIDLMLVNDVTSNTEQGGFDGSLGMLIWLSLPFIVCILFQYFPKQEEKTLGIKLNFKENKKWYLLSLILFPIIIIAVITIGFAMRSIDISGNAKNNFDQIFALFISTLVFTLLKNILEESIFRGFLTTKLESKHIHRIANHILTGLVWGLWHIPYLVFVIGYYDQDYFSMDLIIRFIIGCIAVAIIFGEIRLRTNSIWPTIILHTVGGAFAAIFITSEDLFIFTMENAWLIFPVVESVLFIVFALLIGIIIYKINSTEKKSVENNSKSSN